MMIRYLSYTLYAPVYKALQSVCVLLLLAMLTPTARGQEGLNLPADLFVLRNDGQIERYGVGSTGVRIVSPADAFVIDFGVDPAGARLAYRTEAGLFALDVPRGADPLGTARLVEGASADVPPLRGLGRSIAWSPTGDAIAYTTLSGARIAFAVGDGFLVREVREGLFVDLAWSPGGRFLAARTVEGVVWVYRRDGRDDAVALPLASVLAATIESLWVSDAELVFTAPEGGLRVMNLDQANAQTPLLEAPDNYRLPTVTPTGDLLVFGRAADDPVIPPGSGVLLRLDRTTTALTVAGQVALPLADLRWAPGASLLVAFQGGVLALYDPRSGTGFPLPLTNPVAYDWGALIDPSRLPTPTPPPIFSDPAPPPPPEEANETEVTNAPPITTMVGGLRLSADLIVLTADRALWRIPADGTAPRQATPQGVAVVDWAISPDGQQIVYQEGTTLWWLRDRQAPRVVLDVGTLGETMPTFSPDGTQIAYISGGIWLTALEAPAPELLRASRSPDAPGGARAYLRPQFSPDGASLLLDVTLPDHPRGTNALIDLATRDYAEVDPTPPDYDPLGRGWLADGTLVHVGTAGIYTAASLASTALGRPAEGELRVPLPNDRRVVAWRESAEGEITLALCCAGEPAQFTIENLLLENTNTPSDSNANDSSVVFLQAPQLSADGRFLSGIAPGSDLQTLTDLRGVWVVDLLRGGVFEVETPPEVITARWVN